MSDQYDEDDEDLDDVFEDFDDDEDDVNAGPKTLGDAWRENSLFKIGVVAGASASSILVCRQTSPHATSPFWKQVDRNQAGEWSCSCRMP